jgi:acetoacetyl-CoA synthetase
MSTPLWTPSDERVASSHITAFLEAVATDWDAELPDYAALQRWSIDSAPQFWLSLRDYAGVEAESWEGPVITEAPGVPGVQWFPEARLNFAQNLLRDRDPDSEALVFHGEDFRTRRMSFRELRAEVAQVAHALRALGLEPGDRVAGFLHNGPEAVIAMLATVALGGTWTSCSPDFGVQGVLDRFGQVDPKVLFGVDGYRYKGKTIDTRDKLRSIRAALPSVDTAVVVPYANDGAVSAALEGGLTWAELVDGQPDSDIPYVAMPFNHPLYIMYSSGTTGAPKCIVHGAGGTLLQHLKEHKLHCDVQAGDRVFYFTTCGWMMWNWLVSALAAEATLVLYDGNPFHPGPTGLFDLADAEGITLFGTSAKFIDALAKAGARPAETHDLSTIRLITSTGSPLVPESFDYVYEHIKRDVQLASISGGTDIIGCFVCGDPTGPVWRGEIQTAALAMDVAIYDDDGNPVVGQAGELVCRNPFPSMPVCFWGDPEGTRYHGAYFARFDGVWCHGDWAEQTERGGFLIHGRSDATLNPGGVRIGTAEIYRVVEQLDDVLEAVVIGQRWQADVRVVLFVRLRDGVALDAELQADIRRRIRQGCSPRHVPACILEVDDIPRTRSGKISELAVKRTVHGEPIKNREALANPQALAQFADRPELRR